MVCDSCGHEVYRAEVVDGKLICYEGCHIPKPRLSAAFACINDIRRKIVRGFHKAQDDAIASRQVDYQGNVYEHGKLKAQRPHAVALKMDKRIRERNYALKHGQIDPAIGWHVRNPDLDVRVDR